MENRSYFATLVVHWFSVQLLSMILFFCAKKKQDRSLNKTPSQLKANVAQPAGEPSKPAINQTTPAKNENPNKDDDDDDVKFNINIKKPEEKKDEFDDDEENPLAKITMKPRNKNGPGKKAAAGGQPKPAEKNPGKAVKTKEEVGPERPFLAPNEKQYGVSCYQFEPSQQQAAAPAAPPKKVPMQKSTDGPRTAATRTIATAPTQATAPSVTPSSTLPSATTPIPQASIIPTADTNTKSTISLTGKAKPKTVEQERTNNDNAVEKTQKDGGDGK
ncbi:unnamed protein product [Caenorhabditis nigoni]